MILSLHGPIVELLAKTGPSTSRPVRIVAYRGGLMKVAGFGAVVVDLANLELPDRLPLLLDHQGRIEATAGWGTPRVIDGQLVVEGHIVTQSEAGRLALTLLEAGTPLGASVGVEVLEVERVQPNSEIKVNDQAIRADTAFLNRST